MANLTPANGNKPKRCDHNNCVMRVISTVVTCETTAIFCQDCGKQLSKPKTDC